MQQAVPMVSGPAYGRVTFRNIVGIADSADAGDEPDYITIGFTVNFIPTESEMSWMGADGKSLRLIVRSVAGSAPADGILRDITGNQWVSLISNTAPGLSRQGWHWRAVVEYNDGTKEVIQFPLAPGETLNLADIIGKPVMSGSSGLVTVVRKGDKGDDGDQGDKGDPGLSAYQVAVAGGYQGSSAAWLASLRGSQGDAGLSAYAVAVAGGYAGTASQWLASLKGGKGDTGLSAYDQAVLGGYSGTVTQWIASLKGQQGDPGTPGASVKGDQGLSAYQVAVAGGYSGTVSQWLASLKGAQGDVGKTAYQVAVDGGYSGTAAQWLASLKGGKGDQGDPGLTAYQVALANGFAGTQTDWLASLKGQKGDQGNPGINKIYIQDSAPTGVTGAYMWVQTGMGTDGSESTIWIEDGK